MDGCTPISRAEWSQSDVLGSSCWLYSKEHSRCYNRATGTVGCWPVYWWVVQYLVAISPAKFFFQLSSLELLASGSFSFRLAFVYGCRTLGEERECSQSRKKLLLSLISQPQLEVNIFNGGKHVESCKRSKEREKRTWWTNRHALTTLVCSVSTV